MIIVITAKGENLTDKADPHFGRATGFMLVDLETGDAKYHSNLDNKNAMQGAGTQAVSGVVNLGANAVVSGSFGPKASQALTSQNVKMWTFEGDLTIQQVIDEVKNGKIGD